MTAFLIDALAVWRITNLLIHERCPFALCEKFRGILPVVGFPAVYRNELLAAFSCLWCLSYWVALAIGMGNLKKALALSAGVIVIDRWINGN